MMRTVLAECLRVLVPPIFFIACIVLASGLGWWGGESFTPPTVTITITLTWDNQ